MNQLIQELAEEARLITVNGQTRYALAEEFEQRFAELIVKECARIAQAGLAPAVVEVINETFGIEQ